MGTAEPHEAAQRPLLVFGQRVVQVLPGGLKRRALGRLGLVSAEAAKGEAELAEDVGEGRLRDVVGRRRLAIQTRVQVRAAHQRGRERLVFRVLGGVRGGADPDCSGKGSREVAAPGRGQTISTFDQGRHVGQQGLADHVLTGLPVVKHVAGALPGTGAVAIRLLRLAGVTAEACCPVSR